MLLDLPDDVSSLEAGQLWVRSSISRRSSREEGNMSAGETEPPADAHVAVADIREALLALVVDDRAVESCPLRAPTLPLTAADACAQLRAVLLACEPQTWDLEVRASAIEGAGDGLHLRGSCEAGVIVALYPGTAYHVDDLHVMATLVLEGNPYVLGRRDGVLIDGRPDGVSAQIFDTAIARERAAACAALGPGAPWSWPDLRWPAHPLAAGHKANHPPRGYAPNVRVCIIDLLPGEEAPLQNVLPFASFRPPADGEHVKRGAALVSTRRLASEEILLDYKLQPGGPLEPWYVPYMPATADTAAGAEDDEGVDAALKRSEPELPPIA
jgi:hypothetical protein